MFSIDNTGDGFEESDIFEDLETNNHHKFKQVILENSKNYNNYRQAIEEWIYYGESYEEKGHCICGHEIMEKCVIHNKFNERTLIVGNICIKKVNIKRKPAKKSKINYLEFAYSKARNVGEKDFVKRLIEQQNSIGGKLYFCSKKELKSLEKLTGIPLRFKSNID